jgi:hypothetical protein
MSGRGGRSRGGLGIAAAAVPPAAKPPPPPTAAGKQSLPPSNIFAAATRVSGRSPARGAPPRGGGSAAGLPAPRGRGTLRGSGPAGVAVTRGASLGHASPPAGGRGGSPLGTRIGGSGGGLRSSPKPPPPTAAASLRGGKPGLSIVSAVGVNKGGVKGGEALADKVVAGITALSPTSAADHLTAKSVIGAAADRLDLKLCDFPETPPPPPTAEEGAVSSSLENENELSSSASAVGDETHSAKATTPSRRRRVFPKLNDNPEAPEVVDVENMKSSSSVSAGGQHSLTTTAKRAAQRPVEAVAAVVVSTDSLNVGAPGDEPVKNGGGGPWVKDKGEMNGLPAAASTTNGYDVDGTTAVEGEEEKERLQLSPVKVVKTEVKTEVEAMVQVRLWYIAPIFPVVLPDFKSKYWYHS